jgi:hypothetical protein
VFEDDELNHRVVAAVEKQIRQDLGDVHHQEDVEHVSEVPLAGSEEKSKV